VLQADNLLFNGHREPRKGIAALHIIVVDDNLETVGTAEQRWTRAVERSRMTASSPVPAAIPRRKIAELCLIGLEKQLRRQSREEITRG
jgi:hypothetical protein